MDGDAGAPSSAAPRRPQEHDLKALYRQTHRCRKQAAVLIAVFSLVAAQRFVSKADDGTEATVSGRRRRFALSPLHPSSII